MVWTHKLKGPVGAGRLVSHMPRHFLQLLNDAEDIKNDDKMKQDENQKSEDVGKNLCRNILIKEE